MQLKTTMRHHVSQVTGYYQKENPQKKTSICKDMEKLKLLCIVGVNIK
jgi:hypothetical protein